MIVLPVFALIVAGWLTQRLGVLGPHATVELNRFVVYLALPALLFEVVANAHWRDLWQPGFIVAYGIACAVTFALAFVPRLRGPQPLANGTIDGLGASYSNTGYLGFPLVLAALGTAAAPLLATATIITACVMFAIAIILIEVGQQDSTRWPQLVKRVGRSLIGNPLVIAPLLGAIFPLSGLEVPTPFGTFVKLLAGAASPCALVALGLFLAGRRKTVRGGWGIVALLVVLKLIVQPAVTWAIARFAFDLAPLPTHTAVLIAALPTGTGPFMLAEFYRRDADITAKAILVSTTLSILTISLYLALIR